MRQNMALHLSRGRPGKPDKAQGFTLLEVLVALTIAGMVMGALFGIIGGNKRLAWRSEEALVESVHARNLINFSMLNNERAEIYIDFENDDLLIAEGAELDSPPRQTQPISMQLKQYEILDARGEVIASGAYWIDLDLPMLSFP